MQQKSVGIEKIFSFRFLMNLYVLNTISPFIQNVCLSFCLSVCDAKTIAMLEQTELNETLQLDGA